MQMQRTPRRVAGAVEAEVDGERVVMSPADFSYFGLTGAGGEVWDLIDGQRRFGEIVQILRAKFAGDPAAIEAETLEFTDALTVAGLVTIDP